MPKKKKKKRSELFFTEYYSISKKREEMEKKNRWKYFEFNENSFKEGKRSRTKLYEYR